MTDPYMGLSIHRQEEKMMKNLTKAAAILLLLALCVLPLAAGGQNETEELCGVVTIFHAGSLSVPLEAIEKAFEEAHPGVDIQREGAGSQACARKITDLGKPCDIMASADYKVIDKLLIPDFADWNVRFATNQLVLCYTDSSTDADVVNADNWQEILQKEGIVWGHSDPNLDPCGYRSLMVLQLAEKISRNRRTLR